MSDADAMPVRVRHFGNTANNAFHNALLLEEFEGIGSELPIRMFGLAHAISAPAWEAIDFEVPDAAWVPQPDWGIDPAAVATNSKYSDIAAPGSAGAAAQPRSLGDRVMGLARSVLGPLYGRAWAQPIFDLSYRVVLARRPQVTSLWGSIDLVYGADSLIWQRPDRDVSRLVCLEHGTVRWVADGDRGSAVLRSAYRRQVEQAQQLWVTNLDPRSLELAEDIAPGRWSALPHPFMLDTRVPFPESQQHRARLLRETDSERLVLLPSSQNWSKHHDKGSIKALTAFAELRKQGVPVGLVAVEWGLQLAESKAFLDAAGVGQHVTWVAPMARFSLQRMMADVDVVWDQFGLDAFGALALRAVEQGTPLVSRGLIAEAERLIGGPVPWIHAVSVEDIMRETAAVFDRMAAEGRDQMIDATRQRYRSWLTERHPPSVTAALQREVYASLVDGSFDRGGSAPDRWAQLLRGAAQ